MQEPKLAPLIIPCPDEASWHRERSKLLGASEVAALFDCHPYLTKRQLWMRKKGLVPPDDETEAMEAGKFAELMLAPWYAKRTGRRVLTPQEFYRGAAGYETPATVDPVPFAIIVRHPTLPLQCTPDRILQCSNEGCELPSFGLPTRNGVLQLKNADRWLLDQWEGEEGAVTAPLCYQVQVQAELLCTGLKWGALAASIGGNRLRHLDIEAHPAFQSKLGAACVNFMQSLALDQAPAPTADDLDEIRRAFPLAVPGRTKELDNAAALMEYAKHAAFSKWHEEQADHYKAQLQAELGDAEVATIGGQKVATWKSSTRRDPPREAREFTVRTFRLDKRISDTAKAAIPHASTPSLPS